MYEHQFEAALEEMGCILEKFTPPEADN